MDIRLKRMNEKTFDTMSEAEFDSLLDGMQAEAFGDLTTDQFFTALESLHDGTLETLELAATVQDGQLIFQEPAPLDAHANELRLGGKRIIIRLVGKYEILAGASSERAATHRFALFTAARSV